MANLEPAFAFPEILDGNLCISEESNTVLGFVAAPRGIYSTNGFTDRFIKGSFMYLGDYIKGEFELV